MPVRNKMFTLIVLVGLVADSIGLTQKRSATEICLKIEPSRPHEEPYFMCKAADADVRRGQTKKQTKRPVLEPSLYSPGESYGPYSGYVPQYGSKPSDNTKTNYEEQHQPQSYGPPNIAGYNSDYYGQQPSSGYAGTFHQATYPPRGAYGIKEYIGIPQNEEGIYSYKKTPQKSSKQQKYQSAPHVDDQFNGGHRELYPYSPQTSSYYSAPTLNYQEPTRPVSSPQAAPADQEFSSQQQNYGNYEPPTRPTNNPQTASIGQELQDQHYGKYDKSVQPIRSAYQSPQHYGSSYQAGALRTTYPNSPPAVSYAPEPVNLLAPTYENINNPVYPSPPSAIPPKTSLPKADIQPYPEVIQTTAAAQNPTPPGYRFMDGSLPQNQQSLIGYQPPPNQFENQLSSINNLANYQTNVPQPAIGANLRVGLSTNYLQQGLQQNYQIPQQVQYQQAAQPYYPPTSPPPSTPPYSPCVPQTQCPPNVLYSIQPSVIPSVPCYSTPSFSQPFQYFPSNPYYPHVGAFQTVGAANPFENPADSATTNKQTSADANGQLLGKSLEESSSSEIKKNDTTSAPLAQKNPTEHERMETSSDKQTKDALSAMMKMRDLADALKKDENKESGNNSSDTPNNSEDTGENKDVHAAKSEGNPKAPES